jgi:hypothetical protein
MKVHAIFLLVDGREYGPFLNEDDEKLRQLLHRKGVEVIHRWIDKPKPVKKPKRKKPENMSLLEMMNFVPRRKGGGM